MRTEFFDDFCTGTWNLGHVTDENCFCLRLPKDLLRRLGSHTTASGRSRLKYSRGQGAPGIVAISVLAQGPATPDGMAGRSTDNGQRHCRRLRSDNPTAAPLRSNLRYAAVN